MLALQEPGGVLDAVLERELAAVKLAKVLRLGAIVQDLADSTLALNDIRGVQPGTAIVSCCTCFAYHIHLSACVFFPGNSIAMCTVCISTRACNVSNALHLLSCLLACVLPFVHDVCSSAVHRWLLDEHSLG